MFNFQNFCIFGLLLTQRISISQVCYEFLEFEILDNPKQYEMIYMGLIPKVTIYLLYSWKSVKAYFSITFKSITSKTKAAVWTKAQTLVFLDLDGKGHFWSNSHEIKIQTFEYNLKLVCHHFKGRNRRAIFWNDMFSVPWTTSILKKVVAGIGRAIHGTKEVGG